MDASNTDPESIVVGINGIIRWTVTSSGAYLPRIPPAMRRTRRWTLHYNAEMFIQLLMCTVIVCECLATKNTQKRPGLAHILGKMSDGHTGKSERCQRAELTNLFELLWEWVDRLFEVGVGGGGAGGRAPDEEPEKKKQNRFRGRSDHFFVSVT